MNTTVLNDHTNNITMALNYHTYKKIKDSYLPVLALTPKYYVWFAIVADDIS
jgi:hypothetical protein